MCGESGEGEDNSDQLRNERASGVERHVRLLSFVSVERRFEAYPCSAAHTSKLSRVAARPQVRPSSPAQEEPRSSDRGYHHPPRSFPRRSAALIASTI